jgi:hypothetical protein
MAAFLDCVRFNPTAGGTTDWTYSSAVTGYQSPAAAGVVNGTRYKYRAESADLSQWEIGEGAYNTATGVLTRTTVLFNSAGTGTGSGQSGAGSLINFSAAPQVAIVALAEDLIPPTTVMIFQQTTAPVGWTKVTTFNDYALRIVSGAASSGGTNAFSTVMAQTTVGGHTLTISEIPAHNHAVTDPGHAHSLAAGSPYSNSGAQTWGGGSAGNIGAQSIQSNTTGISIQNNGGGGSHNHSITMGIQYVDAILAQKN